MKKKKFGTPKVLAKLVNGKKLNSSQILRKVCFSKKNSVNNIVWIPKLKILLCLQLIKMVCKGLKFYKSFKKPKYKEEVFNE